VVVIAQQVLKVVPLCEAHVHTTYPCDV
jgi:hypothetical protein